MRFEVSDDTRQAADCPYGYPCLTDEEWVGCAIDNCVGGTGARSALVVAQWPVRRKEGGSSVHEGS